MFGILIRTKNFTSVNRWARFSIKTAKAFLSGEWRLETRWQHMEVQHCERSRSICRLVVVAKLTQYKRLRRLVKITGCVRSSATAGKKAKGRHTSYSRWR